MTTEPCNYGKNNFHGIWKILKNILPLLFVYYHTKVNNIYGIFKRILGFFAAKEKILVDSVDHRPAFVIAADCADARLGVSAVHLFHILTDVTCWQYSAYLHFITTAPLPC